ncbi:signal recognition particle 9 kDa protein-like isoform X1 [Crassostrea angulata]|nr:signal recognition particle 9 kDa protein-like isoform X1 [Crassostrea angulata]
MNYGLCWDTVLCLPQDISGSSSKERKMTYLTSWEEFAKAAERLYLNDPQKCRFVTKYRHCDGKLNVKVTDDHVCLQYRTEHAQDVKKLEKLTNQLMRHMASKEKS